MAKAQVKKAEPAHKAAAQKIEKPKFKVAASGKMQQVGGTQKKVAPKVTPPPIKKPVVVNKSAPPKTTQ